MTQAARPFPSGRRIFGRAQDDPRQDPYQLRHKPKEPAVCFGCGAIYHRGRWQWGAKPEGAHDADCPACRRIADAMPAGVVTLHGPAALAHKDEIIGLAKNEEKAEHAEHALNRIMSISEAENAIEIRTTDIHLPRRLGEAVKRAFHGEVAMHFDEAGYFVRVDWRAED